MDGAVNQQRRYQGSKDLLFVLVRLVFITMDFGHDERSLIGDMKQAVCEGQKGLCLWNIDKVEKFSNCWFDNAEDFRCLIFISVSTIRYTLMAYF